METIPPELFRLLNQNERALYLAEGGVDPTLPSTIAASVASQDANQLPKLKDDQSKFIVNPNQGVDGYNITTIENPITVGPPPSDIDPSLLWNPFSDKGAPLLDSPVDDSLFDDKGFDFDTPLDLLIFLDDHVRNGRVTPYPWQVQILTDFGSSRWNDKERFQAVVRAANGSGKDKYIMAPCAVWLMMRFKKSLCVVTSSSGAQLDNQTCRYITNLCNSANKKIHPKLWQNVYRKYTIDFGDQTTSQAFCFATDEAGKAEGYHPTDYGCKMAILVSEDKTVPDEIDIALNKCTGYSHRLHVSTPGLPIGHFFGYCNRAIPRETFIKIEDKKPSDWVGYHITAYDCPRNLEENYIEQMKIDLIGGEFGAAFQSQVKAEFTTTDEMVVCTAIHVWNAINKPRPWISEPYNQAGLDLSAGGDETALTVKNGNKHLITIPFRFSDTQDTIDFLEPLFYKWGLDNDQSFINGDAGGLGKPILDSLRRKGWRINYVTNQSRSNQPRSYANVGTQLWFNLRKLMESREIILQADLKLQSQLTGRYYKMTGKNIHQLLSKLEQKKAGYPSPDRADSLVLAFSQWKPNFAYIDPPEMEQALIKNRIEEPELVLPFSIRDWAQDRTQKWTSNNGQNNFSIYQNEIDEYNRQIKLSKKN